ncbi:endonuclease/exonuclease/phosphatase family protein [Microvirga pudoricolor]|uniref:endonuclease/exonuclease/phosphatase family protein n=1 Tax=Microvirga pudoricolor TaxID=2778729 RepID=UPI00194F3962|nr:endonuclease/exonuclease/phosphatase family protein [Microvirga pudoricolor]MBM6594830.1 endonuclease/exonuclease/phosphatase family protein [Microvirga pudoricolor]
MLKIITWNIQWGLGADGSHSLKRQIDDARGIADFDVLCLQEVADNFSDLKNNPGGNGFAEIAALLPGFTPVEGVALDIPGAGGGRSRFGNMVLSRHPVAQVLRHTLPWEAVATRNMPRVLIEATILPPSGPLRIMTTHFDYSASKLRRAEVEGVREAHRLAYDRTVTLRESGRGTYKLLPTTASAVLTGDLNMKPDDPVRQRISDPFENGAPALVDVWTARHGRDPHPDSFCIYDRSSGQPHCSDYIYVTEDLAPRVNRVYYDQTTQSSDHQPVLLELDL